ncbi:MAG: M1 family metallopeptidase [Cytophagaceae bacterium]|nr:M1 family metallopeptidase [Cytophagaceae bacterium]
MIAIIRVFFPVCFVLLLISCKTSKKPAASTHTITTTIQPEKTKLDKGPYQASEILKNDLLHTKLEVSFDWGNQYLNGIATLKLKPYFYSQNTLLLDAKGMDIHYVKLMNSSSGKDLIYEYDKKVLAIKLDKLYTRKDTFVVQIKYTAKPNELPKGGSDAITSDKGLYFINPDGKDPDKPRQIWTQGETEASSCWFPTIDQPNEKTTEEIFITVDTSFTALSNGKLISVKKNQGLHTFHWAQNKPHAPYLFMMAIGKFSIIKDKWRNLEVNYYVEPKYAPYAKNIFGYTPEMMEFFSNKFGYAFPWDKYSQVVVRDYVSGAMENTTATVFMEAVQSDDRALEDENWESIIAHELFHHWFGDLVTCESWSNLPLNESFANYSEYLWAEYKHGVDAADYHGENETNEYFEEAKRKQEPLIRYHYLDKEDMFDRHSYNKGGRILHMLRKYVGDEAFFESLKLYLNTHAYQPVEVHDLRLAFEKTTGEDLNWFFNQWFFSPGHPQLKISHVYSGGMLLLTVKQIQDTTTTPVYKLPLKIDTWINGIKTTHPIIIEKAEQTFEISLMAQPELVMFDSDMQLLGKTEHEKPLEEWVLQYNYYDKYFARKQALKALFSDRGSDYALGNPFDNAMIRQTLLKAMDDPFWAIRSLALDQISLYSISDFAPVLKKMEWMALNDTKSLVRAKAINQLSSYSNKDYVHIYKKAIFEKPYSVAGAGLSGYLKSGDQSLKMNFEELEQLNSIYIVLPLADYYINSEAKNKFDWFKRQITKGSPRVIYNMLDYFVAYSLSLDKEKQEETKLILKTISENHRYEQIRFAAEICLKSLEEKGKE